MMKTAKELNKRKIPIITIDEPLEKYKDKIICPEKLRKTNEMLKTARLPENKHHS